MALMFHETIMDFLFLQYDILIINVDFLFPKYNNLLINAYRLYEVGLFGLISHKALLLRIIVSVKSDLWLDCVANIKCIQLIQDGASYNIVLRTYKSYIDRLIFIKGIINIIKKLLNIRKFLPKQIAHIVFLKARDLYTFCNSFYQILVEFLNFIKIQTDSFFSKSKRNL